MMESAAAVGLTTEEIEKKREERMKRFGQVEVEEAMKSAAQTSTLAARRKSKLAKKLKRKQGGQSVSQDKWKQGGGQQQGQKGGDQSKKPRKVLRIGGPNMDG